MESMMELLQRVRKTDLARNTRKIIRDVLRGKTAIVESHGLPEVAIVDVIDYYLKSAALYYFTQSSEVNTEEGLPDETIAKVDNEQERYNDTEFKHVVLEIFRKSGSGAPHSSRPSLSDPRARGCGIQRGLPRLPALRIRRPVRYGCIPLVSGEPRAGHRAILYGQPAAVQSGRQSRHPRGGLDCSLHRPRCSVAGGRRDRYRHPLVGSHLRRVFRLGCLGCARGFVTATKGPTLRR